MAVASFLSTAAVAAICIGQFLTDPTVGNVNNASLCGAQFQETKTANMSHGLGSADDSIVNHDFTPNYPAPTLTGFVSAFGTVMYAFNFVPVFPTIQASAVIP